MPDIRGASLSSSEESDEAREDLNGLLGTVNNTSSVDFLQPWLRNNDLGVGPKMQWPVSYLACTPKTIAAVVIMTIIVLLDSGTWVSRPAWVSRPDPCHFHRISTGGNCAGTMESHVAFSVSRLLVERSDHQGYEVHPCHPPAAHFWQKERRLPSCEFSQFSFVQLQRLDMHPCGEVWAAAHAFARDFRGGGRWQ